MRAVVFHGPGQVSVGERPIPEAGPGDVLVKVHACGICGTDIHILHGEYIVEFPVIPGHEFSGIVEQVGCDVTHLLPGDAVTIDPNIADRTCFFCRRGEINLCENLRAIGVNFDGGLAEYCRVPAAQVYKTSADLDSAAMTEPLACCIHGMDRLALVPGETVVVLGAGTIGLMLIQLARIAGAHVIASEPAEEKRALAERFGADAVHPSELDAKVKGITSVGADAVIESAGRVETAELAPKLARRGGRVLQFGVVSPGREARIQPYDLFYRELTIIGSFVNPFTHSRAVEMLEKRQVEVAPLVTHRFPLAEIETALAAAASGEAVKVLVVP
ncbi:MAG: zinc-dependent alcohol dehydrogenase family protein [Armatimonadota bacterium]